MANPVDILIGKKAIEDFDVLIAKTIKAQEEILKLGNDALKASGNISKINTPSGVTSNSNNAQNITASLNKQTEALAKTQSQIERLRVAEIKLQQQREKAFDSYDKKIQKQIQLEEKASQKAIAESNKIIAQKEKEFAKFEKEFNKYEADLAKKAIAEENAKKKAVQSALDQSKAFQSLQAQKERALTVEAKQQQVLARSETAYQRIQSSVNLLTKTYQDLAIRRELGGTLTKREEAQLVSLTNRLNLYQTALKKVDADIQKNQRNVGNYASGWNGLGNSINQITRELPAFTFSAQTGFLALSNNIPILTDEIGKLQRANAELVKKGEPVKSVLSQILGGVFSLQTAMGVGILLFTLYGKEIGEFVKGLFNSKKAFSESEEQAKRYNSTMTSLNENLSKIASDEITRSKVLFETAKNTTLSYEQRIKAVNELKQSYPEYLKNLSDEKILAGDTAIAENILTQALINRATALASIDMIEENVRKKLEVQKKLALELNRIEKIRAEYGPQPQSDKRYDILSQAAADEVMANLRAKDKIKLLEEEEKVLTNIFNQNSKYLDIVKSSTSVNTGNTKSIKDNTKAKEEQVKHIRGSIGWFEKLIETNEKELAIIKERSTVSLSENEDYIAKTKIIEEYKKGLNALLGIQEELSSGTSLDLGGSEFITDEESDKIRKAGDDLRKLLNDFKGSFITEFAEQSGFSKLFDILNGGLEKFEGDAVATALAFSDAFQQAFNTIATYSQANFDAEYTRLELQKEVAIKFAGESTTAQEAVNEEYERRRKAIARREAESKKDLAVFNSIINTAQGVTSALASANIPLAITIGILGAIQTGFIASQEIPQFFDGGTHKGGLMLVNDGKGSNYKETIVTPDGKVINPTSRNVLMDAPKGTQIFNANQTKERDAYLQSFLQERGISMNFQPKEQNGISTNDFNNGISRLERTMLNSSSGSIVADKKGIALWKSENGRRTKVLNNRLHVRK